MSNPFVNLLFSRLDPGGGVQYPGNGMDDFKGLTDAYSQARNHSAANNQSRLTDAFAAFKAAAGPDAPTASTPDPKVSPLDRIKAAFEDLRGMHKGPSQTYDNTMPLSSGPSPFDNAQWPQGPVGAPGQGVPMPQPRPPEAPRQPQGMPNTPMGSPFYGPLGGDTRSNPQYGPLSAPEEQSPLMAFFKRNAAMQQDPSGGGLIDPSAAASAGPGILSSLFG